MAQVPVRRGNRSDRSAPQGVYPCAGKDNWCALSVETNNQWQALATLIGQERWATDARFENLAGRQENQNEIDQANFDMEQDNIRVKKSKHACVRRASARRGCAASTKSSTARLARRYFLRWPNGASVRCERQNCPLLCPPSIFPPRPARQVWASIAREVLRAWINCSDADIENLKREQVLQ